MLQKIAYDYKYRPHIPLGIVASVGIVSLVGIGIIIGNFGSYHSAILHQNISMLSLMSFGGSAFAALCILGIARARKNYDLKNEIKHLFRAPHEVVKIDANQTLALPNTLLCVIAEYGGTKRTIDFLITTRHSISR